MPYCPFTWGLHQRQEMLTAPVSCSLAIGILTLRKEEAGAPAVLGAELAKMPPMAGLSRQRWDSLIIPFPNSTLDRLWLKGEKMHTMRITTRNRSVPGDRRECCLNLVLFANPSIRSHKHQPPSHSGQLDSLKESSVSLIHVIKWRCEGKSCTSHRNNNMPLTRPEAYLKNRKT